MDAAMNNAANSFLIDAASESNAANEGSSPAMGNKPLFDYNLELLKNVECPACLESMNSYIYLCELGHSVCQTCRLYLSECPVCRNTLTNRRNYMLEAIAEHLYYPCTHNSCAKYIRRKHIVPHYLDCDYKVTQCILDDKCKWKGPRIDIKEHILQKHSVKAWMRNENLDKWRENSQTNIQAIIAYDNLFYIYMKRVNVENDPNLSFIYWGLQYIGPSEDAKKYEFSMNIYSDLDNRNVQFREVCHNHKLTVNQIIETGRCVSISVKKMRTYLNQYNCVFFKLQVIKLDE